MAYSSLRGPRNSALVSLVVGGFALALAGCAGNTASKPAPTASQAPKSAAPAESGAQATPGAAPEPQAPPTVSGVQGQEPQANVTITAVDQNGKTVELAFESIYFDFDKYDIKPAFFPAIKHDAETLAEAPGLHVIIEGHCDERGTTEYNLALGERRAVAVYNALAAQSVAKSRMKTISYGKERPVDSGHSEQAWAKNRFGGFRKA